MVITSAGQSDVGRKRKNNQDSFLINRDLNLFIVADGMGGHKGGEVASRLCVEVIEKYYKEHPNEDPKLVLSQGINMACETIYQEAQTHEELSGMGTTVVALLFKGNSIYVGQVGDSRCYLLQSGGVWQITEDHSLLNEELRAGRIQASQVQDYQFKNVITRSVGYESKVVVDIYERKVAEQDTYVLCSDGLSGLVNALEIKDTFQKHTLEPAVAQLIDLANQRGGDDNITVLACQVKA